MALIYPVSDFDTQIDNTDCDNLVSPTGIFEQLYGRPYPEWQERFGDANNESDHSSDDDSVERVPTSFVFTQRQMLIADAAEKLQNLDDKLETLKLGRLVEHIGHIFQKQSKLSWAQTRLFMTLCRFLLNEVCSEQ